jgi:hypothetical protein
MDPAHTSGTGTPAPGGLTSALQREILWHLKGVNAVGGDVVEVSPPYDEAAKTAIVGAIVAMDILHILGEARDTGPVRPESAAHRYSCAAPATRRVSRRLCSGSRAVLAQMESRSCRVGKGAPLCPIRVG